MSINIEYKRDLSDWAIDNEGKEIDKDQFFEAICDTHKVVIRTRNRYHNTIQCPRSGCGQYLIWKTRNAKLEKNKAKKVPD